MRTQPLSPARSRERARARRERRRRRALLLGAALVLLALGFFGGVAVGRALEQAPRPGGTQTLVRTLEPATVAPAETVTVTVPSG